MKRRYTHRLRSAGGFTLLEILVAAFLTSILAAAAFNFYISAHNSSLVQQEISESHQVVRASLDEIGRTLRNAGYKLSTHPPYEISGDTLRVFFSMTKPVDTVQYYLEEFDDAEYTEVKGRPQTLRYFDLMRRVNSEAPVEFAPNFSSIQYNVINASTIEISMTVLTTLKDEDFPQNNGFHRYTNGERVNLRNTTL